VLLALVSLWFFFANLSINIRTVPLTDPFFGRIQDLQAAPKYAIATFLDDSSASKETDFYFIASRLLTYQILHANRTRCRKPVTFIVLVTPEVSQEKRYQLKKDGATVIEGAHIPLPPWIKTGVTKWRNQFVKLRLLQLTQYDRIAFFDADTLLMRPLDGVFDDTVVQTPSRSFPERRWAVRSDEAQLPAQYVFAARPDNWFASQRDHSVPPKSHDQLSAGFWVVAPSVELFGYLLSVLTHPRRFNPRNMEQALLKYAFRRDGAMPWSELNYKWSATWPNDADVAAGVASLHEKLWTGVGPDDLQRLWWQEKKAMESFYLAKQNP